MSDAEPAPESWDGGLREAAARALWGTVDNWPWEKTSPEGRAYARRQADAVLALPELAALRAKADAADRVRELLETWQRCAADEAGADLRIWAGALRKALDGPSPC